MFFFHFRPGSGEQGGEEEDDLLEGEGDPEEEVELEAAEEEARPPSDPQGGYLFILKLTSGDPLQCRFIFTLSKGLNTGLSIFRIM